MNDSVRGVRAARLFVFLFRNSKKKNGLKSRILRLSQDLPVVIEIVDTEEQIDRVLPFLDEMVGEGMVTLERVQIIAYRGSASEPGPGA